MNQVTEELPKVPALKLGLSFTFALACIAVFIAMHAGEEITRYSVSWAASFGISFAFRLDGLSVLFALMISVIGTMIFAYSSVYMRNHSHPTRFLCTLFCFALSMLGLVLADDIILLFVCWELTGITSYLLIGTHHTSEIARRNALQALLITGGGGLLLLAGLIWMSIAAGSFLLSDILASPDMVLASNYFTPMLLLVLIGCFTKSAQFPFHFWLPNAMAAPTPVSAYLHSATMVKAGIYLLARLQPVLSLNEYWTPILAITGGITMLWASLQALKQDDMKTLLAYTTLMALGTLTLLLAFPSRAMAVGVIAFIIAHALYKAPLFMMVGIIDKYTGSRRLSKLSGVGLYLPQVKWLAGAAALSMAGIPLFIGFLAKEITYSAIVELPSFILLVAAACIIANMLMIFAAYLVAIKPFIGAAPDNIQKLDPPERLMWIPAAILSALGVIFGTLPFLINDSLVQTAASSLSGIDSNVQLKLWHGFNSALALSVLTLVLGALCIWKSQITLKYIDKLTGYAKGSAEAFYFSCITTLENIALLVHHTLHHDTPNFYVRVTLAMLAASLLTALAMTHNILAIIPPLPSYPDWIGVSMSMLAVAGAWVASRATSKVMALASLGTSGFSMAGIFLLHGALDVAMTQLLVETLVVVLAAAVLWRHPDFSETRNWDSHMKKTDIIIASAAGLAIYLMLCSVLALPLDLSITYFYENASFALAHGKNIVNVILVDFRAFDTFGEATVIAVAAIGLWSMTKRLAPKAGTLEQRL